MKNSRRCFYRDVRTDRLARDEWQILLDQKPAKTPVGNLLILRTSALADAIAEEWRNQTGEMRPETMKYTRLANTAIDRILPNPEAAVADLLKFAACDLLCIRAPGPQKLVERQSAAWDPLLEWFRKRYCVQLATTNQMVPVQHSADLAALQSRLLQCDQFSLAALVSAANILGSVVLALALRDGQIDPAQAIRTAELESLYQAEIWGEDRESLTRNFIKLDDVSVITKFFAFNGAV